MSSAVTSPDGHRHLLAARTIVGRGPACVISLQGDHASRQHARLAWANGRWSVADLGSLNGTFVNGQPVPAGTAVPLRAGDRLSFGPAVAGVWTLAEDGPPVAFAVRPRGGVQVEATDDVLCLPSAAEPDARIYRGDGGHWWMEHRDSTVPIEDAQQIALPEVWRVYLPSPEISTLSWEGLALDSLVLRLQASRADLVHARILGAGRTVDLGVRRPWEVLLELARERRRDVGGPPHDRGWVDIDLLASQTLIERRQLDAYISNARAHFARVGVIGSQGIVEARPNQRRLGLDPSRVVIEE